MIRGFRNCYYFLEQWLGLGVYRFVEKYLVNEEVEYYGCDK